MLAYLLLLIRFLVCALLVPLGPGGWAMFARFVLAVGATILTAPWMRQDMAMQGEPFLLLAARECWLGLCFGAGLALVFSFADLAARFALASDEREADPDADNGSLVRRLLQLLAIAFFLQIQGDHVMLQQLIHASQMFPIGAHHVQADLLASLGRTLQVVLSASLQVGLPLLATSLFSSVVVDLASRSLPALWLTGLGPNIKRLGGLLGLAIVLSGVAWHFQQSWSQILAPGSHGNWLPGADIAHPPLGNGRHE